LYKILLLSLGTFALGIDAYIVAGLLPGIATGFDVTISGAGQTVSVFTVCYAVSAPFFGALTAGKPARLVLAAALTIFTLANALSAVTTSFPLLLVSRAIAGIGAGLYTPTALSTAASFVSHGQRGRALGAIVGGLAMGTAVGVPCGLLLAQDMGWRATMWLVTALSGLALAGILLRLPTAAAATPPSLRQRISVLIDPRVAATIAVSFVTSAGSIGLYTYVAPFLHASAGVQDALPYLWAWSLGGLVGIYLSGVIIDATGRPEWVMSGILVGMTAVFVTLTWVLPNAALALLWWAVWGAGAWSTQTPQQHRLLSLHPDKGSIVVALQSSAHYSGSAAGAAVGGLALGAGVSLTQLPTLAGLTLAVALIGQLVIAVWSRSSDRGRADYRQPQPAPVREAVEGEPL
jgi:predicted MFS family arabinose efflux permease